MNVLGHAYTLDAVILGLAPRIYDGRKLTAAQFHTGQQSLGIRLKKATRQGWPS